MNKSLKTKITLGSIILGLAMSANVYAESHHHSKAGDHCKEFSKKEAHENLPSFLKGIELSKDQQSQIGTLVKLDQSSIETHHQQRGALMKELQNLSNTETFNEKQAEAIANQFANLEKDELLNRARNGQKIFSLLTPEQRQKANENIKKHMEKMDNMKTKPVGLSGFNKTLSYLSIS